MTESDNTTPDNPASFQPDQQLTDAIAAFRYTVGTEQFQTDELVSYLQDKIVDQEQAYRRLEGAIATSRTIGMAVGIVMSVKKVSDTEAFAMIARISQQQNRKVRLIADDIVLTGTL